MPGGQIVGFFFFVMVVFAATVAILVWGGAAYLVFYLPVRAEMLADFGVDLSPSMQMQLNASDFLKSYALFLSPILLIVAALPFYPWSNQERP